MRERLTRHRIVLSLLVVAVVAAILAKSDIVSWRGVLEALGRIGAANMLLALSMALAQYVCVALRFVVLLARQSVPPFQVVRIFTNGQLLNHLLPARSGDLYKVVALKRAGSGDPGFSTAHVVSALVLERAISTLVLVSLMVSFTDWSALRVADLQFVDRAGQMKAAAGILALLAAALYVAQRRSARLRSWLREFRRGFRVVLDLRRFVAVLCLSAAMWVLEVGSMALVAAPLGFELQLGQGLSVLLLLNLGIAVPVTLGNIGTYEASVALGLGLWGVATSEAIAVAIVHHFLQITALLLLSGLFGGIGLAGSGGRAGGGSGPPWPGR